MITVIPFNRRVAVPDGKRRGLFLFFVFNKEDIIILDLNVPNMFSSMYLPDSIATEI